jgi:hypothetical protein
MVSRLAVLVLALLVASCGGSALAPAAPTQTPSPIPTPTPTPHVFSPREFTVGIYYEPDDAPTANALSAELPQAWAKATGGRSSLTRTLATPDIYILLGNEPPATIPEGIQRAWFFHAPGLMVAYLHRGAVDPTITIVHEIAHLLGAPHWTDCPTPPVEIMCAYQGSATTFSDRELRAMGL